MPYATIEELPTNIKSEYSERAQEVFLATYNNVFKQTQNEGRAVAAARAAAGKIDGVREAIKVEVDDTKAGKNTADASFYFDATFSEAPMEHDGIHKAKVTIIKPGISANGFYYSPSVLSGLLPLMEGAKAYADHEKKSEIKDRGSRSIRDLVGWYSDVSQSNEGNIEGTLNFAPGSERIVEMLKVNPSLVGLSINARGKASRGTVNDKRVLIAEAFEKLYSTDLVTEAAAGGEVTRMVASVTLDHDQDDNPEDTTITEVDMDEKERKEFEDYASWLLAEKDHNTNVATWLATESSGMVSAIESVRRWLTVEELPEKYREAASEMSMEGIEKFKEALKSEPAEKKNDVPAAPAKVEPEPGNSDYQRKFL